LNKNSPLAHIESEFDVRGVVRKLEKDAAHLSKRRRKKKKKYFSSQATQTANDQSLVLRNFRG
jgi:hypothetical protein